jgi:hypothetical protein
MLLGPLLTRVALRSANLYPCQPCSGSLQALIPVPTIVTRRRTRTSVPPESEGTHSVSSLQSSSGRGDEPIST